MRRLIYAPKVWIFIRSSNINGIIFDVSDDVVRGSVTQRLNEVSSASFELRNRYHKWIRDRQNGFRSIFLPMDLVTIWMQRIAGKPIQVFTGYLDSVPYYQAYPGNAVFECTCTLKKLAYNWFDPGMFSFMNWFNDNSEWTWDPTTGAAKMGAQDVTGPTQPKDELHEQAMTDSGLGKLLGQFMIDVAGWAPEDVIIDKMDSRVAAKGAQLYAELESGIATNLKELTHLMKQFLSVNGPTGHPHRPKELKTKDWKLGGGTSDYFSEDEKGDRVMTSVAAEVVDKVSSAASQGNIDPAIAVFSSLVMTNLNPDYEQGIGSSSNWGFGMYAMRPNTGTSANPGSVIPAKDGDVAGMSIDKAPLESVYDASVATRILAARLNGPQAQGPWVAKAKGGDVESMVLWLSKALGRAAPPRDNYATLYADALRLTSQEASMDPAKQVTPGLAATPGMTFSEPAIQARMTMIERSVAVNEYASSKQELLVPTFLKAKSLSSKLRLGRFPGLKENEIFITGPPRELQAFYDQIAGDATYESVRANIGGKESAAAFGVMSQAARYLGGFARAGGGMPADRVGGDVGFSLDGVIAAIAPVFSGALDDVATAGIGTSTTLRDHEVNTPQGVKWINKQVRASTGEGGASFPQLAAFSANASFGANFAFPGDFIQSQVITGQKALINDTSCIDAVRQFTQASMRTFRSLPDGRFIAFYPDYFSARRKPYWKIEDIEIIDFGIQLNDEALATHVFVIGDHFMGEGEAFQNVAASRGVASVTHAGIVDTMVNWGKTPTGPAYRLKNGMAFLKHYGARPLVYDAGGGAGGGGAPLIRNSMYEFLLAWQQFMLSWASQFKTACRFTFMPEVMAGGVIEFGLPHGIQMFCSQVTHNFDYTGGFTTDAEMMAPALATTATDKDKRNFPGFALAGGTNTVGVALS